MRRLLFSISLVVPLWLAMPAMLAATPLFSRLDDPDRGYTFLMIVRCLGTPSGLTQISIDTKEEAAAVAGYVEGRLTKSLFLQAMVAADPFWKDHDLAKFADICKPRPGI